MQCARQFKCGLNEEKMLLIATAVCKYVDLIYYYVINYREYYDVKSNYSRKSRGKQFQQ